MVSKGDLDSTLVGVVLYAMTLYIAMTSPERHVVSNHRSFDCLFNSLCWPTTKKHQKFASLAICEGNSLVSGEFPAQIASDPENISIWWRHHDYGPCYIKILLYLVFPDRYPDSKVHGANMGPIWGRQDPGGPHVGPINLSIWAITPMYDPVLLLWYKSLPEYRLRV